MRPTGFEPVTPRLGILCSILLSYGRLSESPTAEISIIQAIRKQRVNCQFNPCVMRHIAVSRPSADRLGMADGFYTLQNG